jgi:para-nitrobenzyl esterase
MKKIFSFLSIAVLITATVLLPAAGCASNDKATAAQTLDYIPKNVAQTTQYGQIRGISGDAGETLAWLGIPYAKPPVNELRWKAPQAPEPWEGVFDASQYGNIGIQVSGSNSEGSEDCLNLNIFRPNTDEKNLPVLMFIHGGNNQTGSNRAFNGYYLARNANCIVVSINYRLGLLGFISLPALKTGDPLIDSGNFALLDMAAALDWIGGNIRAFGGDPGNITVSGHSAGGRDVMAMLISPLFAGKFHKALALSGGLTTSDPDKASLVIAKALIPLVLADGIQSSESDALNWLLSSGQDLRDYLYSLEAARLAATFRNAAIRMAKFPHMYADGAVLPQEGFDTQTFNNVPLLMLTSSNELSLFLLLDPYFLANFMNNKILTDPSIKAEYQFAAKYGGLLYGLFNAQESAERIFGSYTAPIYTCMVPWGDNPAVVGDKMAGTYGATHGIVMPFLTGESNYFPRNLFPESYETPGAKKLGSILIQYISSFMRTGDPNGEGLAPWEVWKSASSGTNMVFDADQENAIIRMSPDRIIYDNVIAQIEGDRSIPADKKAAIVGTVLNGRWFSEKLDDHFKTPGLWP